MTYNLNELRAFLSVVEEGTVGKAADKLGLTQPALSRIVKRLEEDVGEPLFERHSGGMRITAYGAALLPHAQLLHREAMLARDEIRRMRGMATGALRLGVSSGAAAGFIARVIGKFLGQWPRIEIEVVETLWDDLCASLANYQVDLVLAPEGVENDRIIAAADCQWHEMMRVIVGRGHPLLQRDEVTARDLVKERWCFVPEPSEPHQRLKALLRRKGVTAPAMTVQSASAPLLKSLVAHAGFVSWLTAPMYEAEKRAGWIHELSVDGLDHLRTFKVYHRREGILPTPAMRFLEEVRKQAQPSALRAR